MLFRLTTWLIGLRIGWLSRKNKTFRYAVRDKQAVLQFALQRGKAIRYFEFDKGLFTTRSGWHQKHELARSKGNLGERIAIFKFASAGSAMKLLLKGMKDEAAMLDGIREKKLIIEGDFTLFIWFGWLADQL